MCRNVCRDSRMYLYSHVATHTDTPTHSAELRSTQGTIPPWPQWLITFNKANRVLLVRINLFPVLVRGAVTSNCQTLCSMKWGPLSPLPGPKLTIASIFYACAPALLAPMAPLSSSSSFFLFLCISHFFPCNATPSLGAVMLLNIAVRWVVMSSHFNSMDFSSCHMLLEQHILKSSLMPLAIHAY